MELKVATVQYAKSRPVFEKYKPFELRQPEWCVATFILPEFVNYVFFNLRNLLYLIQLKAQRRELIGDYAAAKKTKQELLTVQANLNALLPQNEKERIRSDAERS